MLQNEEIIKSLQVPFPVVTFKENNWFIADTPLLPIAAQGKTQEEAVDNLKAMIEDWMSDPDTEKPAVSSIINVHIGIETLPIKMQVKGAVSNAR